MKPQASTPRAGSSSIMASAIVLVGHCYEGSTSDSNSRASKFVFIVNGLAVGTGLAFDEIKAKTVRSNQSMAERLSSFPRGPQPDLWTLPALPCEKGR
jgi:hypothetical protein